MNLRVLYLLTALCLSGLLPGYSQSQPVPDSLSIFSQPIALDTFVIRSSFDVQAFIRRVKADTTFYKAFRSMHLVPYSSVNDIRIYDSRKQEVAAQHSRVRQEIYNNCRTMTFPEVRTTGNYYNRKGEPNYYTTTLFEYLFLTRDTVCNEDDIVAGMMEAKGAGRIENSKYQLKQLIFNPGSKVSGIPFMADRASIFDPDEARKYDFRISGEKYAGSKCYKFRITPKKEYINKVIYNELTTWFRQSDYALLARDYALSYHTLLYDFDVKMQVRTTEKNGKLFPEHINYNGNWHIFSRKRERVIFDVLLTY